MMIAVVFGMQCLLPVQIARADVLNLPVPGAMVGLSTPFAPLALKGLVVNPQKPLEFQFLVDTGRGPQDTSTVKEQSNQLVKYFLAGLTIPEGDLWVNLSPYEKDRIVPDALGKTDLGRDLLAQDYILKQLTASLIYPEKDLGEKFWNKIYEKAQKQFGTTDIPVNTFNKVWILPDQAQVFENGNAAYVTKSTLKVMLDEDYLALKKNNSPAEEKKNNAHTLASQIIREIIIPEIEKEVNTGKNFAQLRQIFQSLILAKWYKETIQNGLLDSVYTNKNKITGVNLKDPTLKEQIYNQYLQAYKKGVFDYVKEEYSPEGQIVPKKYFSGGLIWKMAIDHAGKQADVKSDGAMVALQIALDKAMTGVDESRRVIKKDQLALRIEEIEKKEALSKDNERLTERISVLDKAIQDELSNADRIEKVSPPEQFVARQRSLSTYTYSFKDVHITGTVNVEKHDPAGIQLSNEIINFKSILGYEGESHFMDLLISSDGQHFLVFYNDKKLIAGTGEWLFEPLAVPNMDKEGFHVIQKPVIYTDSEYNNKTKVAFLERSKGAWQKAVIEIQDLKSYDRSPYQQFEASPDGKYSVFLYPGIAQLYIFWNNKVRTISLKELGLDGIKRDINFSVDGKFFRVASSDGKSVSFFQVGMKVDQKKIKDLEAQRAALEQELTVKTDELKKYQEKDSELNTTNPDLAMLQPPLNKVTMPAEIEINFRRAEELAIKATNADEINEALLFYKNAIDQLTPLINGSTDEIALGNLNLFNSRYKRLKKSLADLKEYFDVIGNDGKLTGETVTRYKAHRDGIKHPNVNAMIFSSDGINVLGELRAADKDVFPSTFSGVGGHAEQGEKSLESIKKEVKQEIRFGELFLELDPLRLTQIGKDYEYDGVLLMREYGYMDIAQKENLISILDEQLADQKQTNRKAIGNIFYQVNPKINTISVFTFNSAQKLKLNAIEDVIKQRTGLTAGIIVNNYEKKSLYVEQLTPEKESEILDPIMAGLRATNKTITTKHGEDEVEGLVWSNFEKLTQGVNKNPEQYTDMFMPFLINKQILRKINQAVIKEPRPIREKILSLIKQSGLTTPVGDIAALEKRAQAFENNRIEWELKHFHYVPTEDDWLKYENRSRNPKKADTILPPQEYDYWQIMAADGRDYWGVKTDDAMTSAPSTKDRVGLTAQNGGIDLNQIAVKRNGKTFKVQFDPAQLNEIMQGGFDGFCPIIINITPIQSPFPLLGINVGKQKEILAKI
ncbi:MAG: hypothetical protein HQL26_05010 [Candidatus Omnitrophica bacterium]|nr:hypothetical protein [Candidatus Omnitrophota bacterium]